MSRGLISCGVVLFMTTVLLEPVVAAPDAVKGLDAVLIIDSSGSMKKTDPHDRRKPAGRLFMSLLGPEDRTGVISFSSFADILSGLTGAGEAAVRKDLSSAIDRVNSRGAHTNIHDAIKRAGDLLSTSNRKEKVIIFMSDGQMDVGDPERDKALSQELLTKVVPEMAKTGIKIYSIAFTEGSDQALLEEMARKSGGAFRVARTDEDLHLVFASLFEKIKSPDLLPLRDGTFSVDKDIQEVTLLITRQKPSTAVVITDPKSRRITAGKKGADVQWFGSPAFDMVTVKQPVPGLWSVKFNADEGNKVFVITDLRLKSSFNVDFVPEGRKLTLDAWMEKDGKPVDNPEILQYVKFAARLRPPAGAAVELKLAPTGDKAGKGVYQAEFTADKPGDYSIGLTAEAETFKREKDFIFKVTQAPPPKPAPAVPAPVRKPEPADPPVSWTSVIVKAAIVNVVIVLLAAGWFLGKKLRGRKKAA